MERSCRCIRFIIRSTGRHAAELLPQLSAVLPNLYSRKPHSCLLYLAAVMADALAPPDTVQPQNIQIHRELKELLHALLPRALQLLMMQDGLKDNPDTVDDLFRLCVR